MVKLVPDNSRCETKERGARQKKEVRDISRSETRRGARQKKEERDKKRSETT